MKKVQELYLCAWFFSKKKKISVHGSELTPPSWLYMVDCDWEWSLGLMEFSYIERLTKFKIITPFFFSKYSFIDSLNIFPIASRSFFSDSSLTFKASLPLVLLIRYFIVILKSLSKFSMWWIISITPVASLSWSLSLLAIELKSLQKQKKKKDGFES